MIFTTKAEYGVRLLVQLGVQGGELPVSLKAIAEAESLPLAYLERIAALLKKAGIVDATRGAHGGYMLARPPAEITMDEVVLALEGHIAPMDCFVDDRERARAVLAPDRRAALRHQAALDPRADGRHPLAAAHHPRGARRLLRGQDPAAVRAAPRARPRHPLKETMADLEIKNLHVSAGDKQILKGVDLHVRSGEFHALMGPNGSGKSTLANALMGHPNLEITEGPILFDGEDITEADPDERARAGLFMAFQYPVAIPGVTVTKYLRMVMNAHREARGEEPISLKDFRKTVEAAMALTKVPKEFSTRYLNEGFSGGEKKRMEILQLALLAPKLAVLDETDSGLDIDALNTVAQGVNAVAAETGMGTLIITHYQRILHIVQPQFVHIMFEGRIVKEGGPELVTALEERGYGWIRDEVAAAA